MADSTFCARACPGSYCTRCDLLVGLDGLHVLAVDVEPAGRGRLTVTVESPPGLMGCPACGVVSVSHGRRAHTLWAAVAPLLSAMAADQTRFEGVDALGVDDHIWHHVSVEDRVRRS